MDSTEVFFQSITAEIAEMRAMSLEISRDEDLANEESFISAPADWLDGTFLSCVGGEDAADQGEPPVQDRYSVPGGWQDDTTVQNKPFATGENLRLKQANSPAEPSFQGKAPAKDHCSPYGAYSDAYLHQPVFSPHVERRMESPYESISSLREVINGQHGGQYPYSIQVNGLDEAHRSGSSIVDTYGPSFSAETIIRKPKKLAIIMNEEHGQVNVCMAVLHELVIFNKYDIHVISWSKAEAIVKRISEFAALGQSTYENSPRSTGTEERKHRVRFHKLPGVGMVRTISARSTENFTPCRGRGLQNYKRIFKEMSWMFGDAETNQAYLNCVDAVVEILNDITPNLVVLDPAMSQGFDACQKVGQKFVILAPNSLKDCILFEQGLWAMLTEYPAMCSGFKYPVPRHQVFSNMRIFFKLVISITGSKELKALNVARHAHGLTGPLPITEAYKKEREYIYASCAETDFPLKKIPANVLPCGPITVPTLPVLMVDPDLYNWLLKGPTVFIHFGSHFKACEPFAVEMAAAIVKIIDAIPKAQVFWKLVKSGEYDITGALTHQISLGRVRIVDGWMDVEPFSVLETGRVACIIHHGGANTYNEAVAAGVPQVICPLWLDCIDYAARVEYLGIGLDGNKVGFPIERNEVTSAVVKILGEGNEAGLEGCIKARALAISEKSKLKGGRRAAAQKIVSMLEEMN